LEQLQRLVAASPDDPLTHYVLGLEYANLERWEDAVAAHAEALRVEPKYSAAYYHKARAEIKAGRGAVARETLLLGIEVAGSVGDEKTVKEMKLLLDTIS
jgi:cytochrome c-type biogenesis protein CcmH/NrfG